MITLESAGATFLRVVAALVIASAWTIPAGVAIGFNPRLARIAQPLAQIAASVPATALFPVLLLGLISLGGGLNTGSILLMLLGTQWYILFNVIAGAIAIPSEFREVADIFRFSRLERWRTVILPAIFPYLVTGLVTASGGAWNASIVAEYFHFKGQVLSTFGLGAEISSATDAGNFAAASFVHHRDGDSGGVGESTGVASALPARRDALSSGSLIRWLYPSFTSSCRWIIRRSR